MIEIEDPPITDEELMIDDIAEDVEIELDDQFPELIFGLCDQFDISVKIVKNLIIGYIEDGKL